MAAKLLDVLGATPQRLRSQRHQEGIRVTCLRRSTTSWSHWVSNAALQSRSARAGSVRVARHAGKKHAANAAMVMTTNAEPKASGSRGLTLYNRLPISRVNPSATAAPKATPLAVNAKPRASTSFNN